ncbi:MAG: N-acetyltransferase [Ramlibacter sp.]|nr:N-acetyltransferase [Ramlibacter sp.]
MPASTITIRPVDRFPEPEFTQLQREVFRDIEEPSERLAAALQAESAARAANAVETPAYAPMRRLGAYEGEQLVGWTCGWMERGGVFYMANSGVIALQRRRGIYSRLLAETCDLARAGGAVVVRSQHSVLNNAVLIAKLRAGFHVSGLSQAAQMGTLVELTLHLAPERQQLFRQRAIPHVAPG